MAKFNNIIMLISIAFLLIIIGGLGRVGADGTYSATRVFSPLSYTPGLPIQVSINVSFDSVLAYGVEENLPIGWNASSISHSGIYHSDTNKIIWGPFFEGTLLPQIFTYNATPPITETGEKAFSGIVDFGDGPVAIGGNTTINNSIPEPGIESFLISEHTEYDILTNTVYLTITENIGKNQLINISSIFNNPETNIFEYSDILMNQSYQKPIYDYANVSQGKYKKVNETCISNINGTICTNHYYDNDYILMTCAWVTADKTCWQSVYQQVSTITDYDYLPLSNATKSKIVIGAISIS